MGFKKAWKCQQYQGMNGPACDCPAWTSLTKTNVQTAEEKTEADCLYKMLPHLMVDVIRTSNRPYAALLEIRNQESRKTAALEALAAAVKDEKLRLAHHVDIQSGGNSWQERDN